MLHAVIMAGGSGTRFWPLSRQALPKQFLRLTSERSLIQLAWDRVASWMPADCTAIVAGESYQALLREHLPDLRPERLYLEPAAKNTAAAIGLAALRLLQRDPDAVMLVMPADHLIDPPDSFQRDVEQAVDIVRNEPDRLVLFGIHPDHPATGYGYIETGRFIERRDGALVVTAFHEKPDLATATQYLERTNYLWNSGIFVWRADRILAALDRQRPQLAQTLRAAAATSDTRQFKQLWDSLESISIDYAVLEHDPHLCAIPASFEWDDIGNWESLSRWLAADESGNVVVQGACSLVNSRNSIVHSSVGHVVVTSGVDDLLVIHTPTATLVARRGDAESLRKVIEQLKAEGFDDVL